MASALARRIALSALMSTGLVNTAHANGGGMGGVATEVTQLLNMAELLIQTLEQIDQTAEQIGIHEQAIIQGEQVEGHLFDNQVIMVIEQVQEAVTEGLSLGYAAENLDARFAERYPDYEAYLDEEYGLDAYRDDYANWSKASMDSVRTALKGIGVQMASIHQEEEIMAQMREMAAVSQTRQQALQTANMIASTQSQQIQKLRQIMAINAQVQSGYIAEVQAEKNATTAKKLEFYNPKDKGPIVGDSPGMELF